MANPEHLKILLSGVEQWNEWRLKHMTPRPDLSGADLRRAHLGKSDLGWVDLSGADLGEADLSESLLRGASLTGANLAATNLRGADLAMARLGEANLSGADLSGASLCDADVKNAILVGADLSGASLHRADLSGADLREARLRRADLTRADVHGANFGGAHLGGARLREVNLAGACLAGADLEALDLSDADLGVGLATLMSCGTSLGHSTVTLRTDGLWQATDLIEVVGALDAMYAVFARYASAPFGTGSPVAAEERKEASQIDEEPRADSRSGVPGIPALAELRRRSLEADECAERSAAAQSDGRAGHLQLKAVRMASPGFITLEGLEGPIRELREFVKDVTYRNRAERRKTELEVEDREDQVKSRRRMRRLMLKEAEEQERLRRLARERLAARMEEADATTIAGLLPEAVLADAEVLSDGAARLQEAETAGLLVEPAEHLEDEPGLD